MIIETAEGAILYVLETVFFIPLLMLRCVWWFYSSGLGQFFLWFKFLLWRIDKTNRCPVCDTELKVNKSHEGHSSDVVTCPREQCPFNEKGGG